MNRSTAALFSATALLVAITGCSANPSAECSEQIATLVTASQDYLVTERTQAIPGLVESLLASDLPAPSCTFEGLEDMTGEVAVKGSALLVYVGSDAADLQKIAQQVADAASNRGFTLAAESEGVQGEIATFMRNGSALEAQVSTRLVTNENKVAELGQTTGENVLLVSVNDYRTE